MKPFLGIDLTTDKKNEQMNGAEFLILKPSPAMARSLEDSSEKADETIEQSKLPLPLRICQWICGATSAIIAIGIIKGLGKHDGVSLAQAYENAAWLFWLAGGCLLVWGILKIASVQKEKTVLGTEESSFALANFEGVCDAIYSELSVPADAKEVDILSFFYKIKDGNIKVCERGMQIAPYLNPIFKVFADSENLYIANLEGKYAFPLTSFTAIHTIKKHIRIISWNKEEGHKEGIYQQYKLTTDDYGCVHCKYYYILEFENNGESWGIYIPCYELPFFEGITGLKAKQE
ncbi:MAG: hypothetical protein J6A68_01660 [Oscillospiraceae bacterium]|nr:hypothetical protein [Oscillospiraceae bacterium]